MEKNKGDNGNKELFKFAGNGAKVFIENGGNTKAVWNEAGNDLNDSSARILQSKNNTNNRLMRKCGLIV